MRLVFPYLKKGCSMKNLLKTVAIAALLAALTPLSAKEGSELKGKYYFKKSCKACHVAGQPGKEVTPLSNTQARWKAYFAAGKHNQGKEKLGTGTKLTPEQMNDVLTFLTAHASDSPQPMTCGG
jgi:cytochrome c2